jgi:hypothetical protein
MDGEKIRDIQRYAKVKIGEQAPPPRRGPAEIPVGGLPGEIRARIEGGNLGTSRARIEQWMEQGYTSLDIAAALLEISRPALDRAGPGGSPGSSTRHR